MNNKKFTFSFVGRQTGAIGITYQISQDYECADVSEAVCRLWTDYELIRSLKLNGNSFECESKHFAKQNEYNYKGLGTKRK